MCRNNLISCISEFCIIHKNNNTHTRTHTHTPRLNDPVDIEPIKHVILMERHITVQY